MPLPEIISTLGVGTFLGSVAGYEYRKRRDRAVEKQDKTQKWFDESLDIIGRGAYNIERARFRGDPDYEAILNELDQFSERLFVKARNPPEGVSESSAEYVLSVAEIYAKASAIAEVNSQKDGVELSVELFQMAKKEDKEEIDLQQAIEGAGEVSPGFSHLVSSANETGVGTGEIADAVEMMLTEWDEDDFSDFVAAAPGGGRDADQTLNQVMNLFFALASDLSSNAYDDLQRQSEAA